MKSVPVSHEVSHPRILRVLSIPLVAASLIAMTALSERASAATSVSQFGITWSFSADRQVGQYANGDWWVVGPVTITNITPKSVVSGGRVIHGSMVNPDSSMYPQQGFDSDMGGWAGAPSSGFSAGANKGRPNGQDISASNPLVVQNGSSLVSCISRTGSAYTTNNRPTLSDVAILTVVASAPTAGTFRPPYCGTDKTHYWNKSQLRYGILKNYTLSGGPAAADMAERFDRPWFELATSPDGRYYHPGNHQNEYGADMARDSGEAMLALHLNASNAAKELLYVRLVQWGIDLYGCANTGAFWDGLGGLNAGRKSAVVLAGLALNDAKILNYANAKSEDGFIFAEDRQTWYVTQSDVGRVMYNADGRTRTTYSQQHVGLPEWGEQHASSPQRDSSDWGAYYRDVNYRPHLAHALAIRFTDGGLQAWNWPAFFDYMDRAWTISSSAMPEFPAAMWRAYRNASPPTGPPSNPTPPTAPTGLRVVQ